jgi:hypothetical protein
MSDPISAIVGIGSQVIGGVFQSRSAKKAAGAQVDAAQQGIDEQARQFDEVRRLLQPYVDVGQPALTAQQAQLGLLGPEQQQAAINQIAGSPLLQSLTQQGEQALLQRASATGGLRGGNLQGALAQFRPAMLQAALDQQYARLGGLTTIGQNAAAGVGSAGMQTGVNTANLLTQQGAAEAGGIIGGAAPLVGLMNIPAQYMGFARGAGLPSIGGLFGGAQGPSANVGALQQQYGAGNVYGFGGGGQMPTGMIGGD